ncbi:hypothetical protein Ancab_037845 [Ancistrocladus abbreviatus]
MESSIAGASVRKTLPMSKASTPPQRIEIPLQCLNGTNINQTCPTDYPTSYEVQDQSTETCPEYFQWIYEDLQPWKINGITREMVEAAKPVAYIRLVIIDGRTYLEKYRGSYQTRDIFTIWGILQLLRLYPGRLPDLDIMFECGDVPVIKKENYTGNEANAPPLFHYCGDDFTLDIVFPDWSFWGWPEINIKPWEPLKDDLKEGNKKVHWMDRLPHAFWKGNPYMGDRMHLLDCNSTERWGTQIVTQDWDVETKLGFKTSNLADQCVHRFKIYIEGIAWSVSEKYILACDSMTLLVKPQFYEFFTRSLQPMKHYWPINPNDLCRSINFAVDWGNKHTERAHKIGRAGSKFVQQELMMNYVYDYMFHLLNEYGKLLRYKPTIPEGAVEVCSETLACPMEGLDRKFKMDTMVKGPALTNPCTMQPPQDPQVVKAFLDKQENARKKVDKWVAQGNVGQGLPNEQQKVKAF